MIGLLIAIGITALIVVRQQRKHRDVPIIERKEPMKNTQPANTLRFEGEAGDYREPYFERFSIQSDAKKVVIHNGDYVVKSKALSALGMADFKTMDSAGATMKALGKSATGMTIRTHVFFDWKAYRAAERMRHLEDEFYAW